MATQGPLSPGTLAEDSSYGFRSWGSFANAGASDDAYASSTIFDGFPSLYLKATNFGFSIPTDATIDGIEVHIERHANSTSNISDDRVRIVKGGVIGSTDKASASAWPNSDQTANYGGASDLWGESWTPANINASDFGAVLAARYNSPSGSDDAKVDHISITVHYTPVAGGQAPRSLHQFRQRRA